MSGAPFKPFSATFQVLEGTDRGVQFSMLELPITIGREEGNGLLLNDERISRFHAKVQAEEGEILLTDLESTNGTQVNGHVVSIRRLRAGDRIQMGRTVLLFGSAQEIAERARLLKSAGSADLMLGISGGLDPNPNHSTVNHSEVAKLHTFDNPEDLTVDTPIREWMGQIFQGEKPLPPLPESIKASDVARLAELFDFLHRQLSHSLGATSTPKDGDELHLPFESWQRLQMIQLALAMYLRAVTRRDG